MDTTKIQKKVSSRLIAHRGLSGIEPENSIAAFIAAANRGYFGIETDVHKTKDGSFVLIHDTNTARVSPFALNVENETAEHLASVRLYDHDRQSTRSDLSVPFLHEYIGICKRYQKEAFLELKSDFSLEDLRRMCNSIDEEDYLNHTVFISFQYQNLKNIRQLLPRARIQLLLTSYRDVASLLDMLSTEKFDVDIYYPLATKEFIDACHRAQIRVNAWTVDSPKAAELLIENGIDFITTNILE